jgi:hypothetical protein
LRRRRQKAAMQKALARHVQRITIDYPGLSDDCA